MATSSGENMVEMREDASGSFSAETIEESAEGSENYDHYYCEKCKYSFKTQCDVHGPPIFALDHITPVGTPQRPLLTLPSDLVVGWSRARKGCLGVYNMGTVVPVGTHFGPYDGEVVSEEEALHSVYSWVICNGKGSCVFIDATRDTRANWMRFVTCSRNSHEQNVVAYQQGGRLLFRCCTAIKRGQELLVWYADDYAKGLGLTWDQLWDYKCSTNTDPGLSQMLSCPYCRFTFPERTYLQRHVMRSHAEQYQNFMETAFHKYEEDEHPVNPNTLFLGPDGLPSDHGHICSRCGRSFARAYHLKRHEEAVHSPDKMVSWARRRGPKSQRKASNPRRHKQSPDKEDGEWLMEEGEEGEDDDDGGEEADGKRMQTELEELSCSLCSIDFSTPQETQEHMEQHHPQSGDPSDPLYQLPARKSRLGRPGLGFASLKRGRGRPRSAKRVSMVVPKHKRPRKILQDNGALQPPAEGDVFLMNRGDVVVVSVDGAPLPAESEPAQAAEEPTTCGGCQRAFGDLDSLQSHLCAPDAEAGGLMYSCGECQLHFNQASNLRRHQRSVHSLLKPYCCFPCGKFYTQASGLSRHLEGRQHKRNRSRAAATGVRAGTVVGAVVGAGAVVGTGSMGGAGAAMGTGAVVGAEAVGGAVVGAEPVVGDGAKGNDNGEGDGNAGVAVPEVANIYSCNYCQFSFTASRYLVKHVKRHHPTEFVQALDGGNRGGGGGGSGLVDGDRDGDDDGDGDDGDGFTQICPQCDKTFTSMKRFKSHRCFRHGERVFSCPICCKGFGSFYGLQQHQRTHTGERPYPCPQCSKSFAVSGQLAVHLRTHTGERPYLCAQCGESFRQSGDLKRHEQKHMGVRPHPCPQCSKSFSRPQSLRAHLQTHSGQRLFHCTHCNKSFTRGYHLTRHYHKMHSALMS